MEKTVPSPRSTGGAGTTYEQHVGAMFLALLLTRGIPPVFLDCQVKKVSFQTRHLGWKTDDLLVVCSRGDKVRKLALQVKITLRITKNRECAEMFQRFWDDFRTPGRFDPDRDALVIATPRSVHSLDGLGKLLDCARSSADTDDFNDRLKLVPNPVRRCHQTVQSIVRNADPSDGTGEGSLWRFLRAIRIMFLDFAAGTSRQEAAAMQCLAHSSRSADTVGAARNAWRELVMIAADAASSAKTLSRPDLPRDMRKQYSAMPDAALQPLLDHSATVMNAIHSTIGRATSLPRAELMTEIAGAFDDSVVVLTGPLGSGKSALAKAIIGQRSDSRLCLSFRAAGFGTGHIDNALPGSISGEQFGRLVGAQEGALIYVDGFEHLLEHTERQAFEDLVTITEGCPNALLLLTCRDSEVARAADAFSARRSLKYREIKVPPLSADEIKRVCKEIPDLKAPLENPELAQVMNTPYAVNMATRMTWSGRQPALSGAKAFREKWWSDIVRNDGETVRGLPAKREKALIQLAVHRGKELRFSIPADGIDAEVLDKMRKDGIIRNDGAGLVTLTHDVIEDWAVRHWIECLAERHEWQALPMANGIGAYHAIRRVFREWLRGELDASAAKAYRFVLSVCRDDSLPRHFVDDVLVSLLLSNSVSEFISREQDLILKGDASLLARLIRWTCVACTKFDKPSGDHPTGMPGLFVPDGKAWPALLEAADDNLDRLLPKHFHEVLGLLEGWVKGTRISAVPDGATPAVNMAYRLLTMKRKIRRNDRPLRQIFSVIARVPSVRSDLFQQLVEQATLEPGWNNQAYHEFRQTLIRPSGLAACRDAPKAMTGFILSLRLPQGPGSSVWEPGAYFHSESRFGLRMAAKSSFRHPSAFCGPFLHLLRLHPETGISLVMDLVNHAGERYGNHEKGAVPRIEVAIAGHGKVTQWADCTLWRAYRGTSDVPHVIMCALMALEYRLLEMCQGQRNVEPLLLKILLEGRSVMTTAVVAGVCAAYPDVSRAATSALLGSRHCIDLDRNRREKGGYEPTAFYVTAGHLEKYYRDERKRSNALPHRQCDLETVAHALRHKNSRKTPLEGGNNQQAATPKTGKTDTNAPNRGGPETEKNPQAGTAFSLYEWGVKRWRRDPDGDNAVSWRRALAHAQSDDRPGAEPDVGYFIENGPPAVAAVCVRDRWNEMSDDERRWCTDTLIAEIELCSDDKDVNVNLRSHPMGSDSMSARILPKILARHPRDKKALKAAAESLTHESHAVRLNAARGVADFLGPSHPDLALRCAGIVAMLPNISSDKQQSHEKRSVPSSGGSQAAPTPSEAARQKLLEGPIDAERELEILDIKSGPGSDAAMSIILMLGRAPDLPVAGKFIARVVRAVVGTFAAERQADYVDFGDEFVDKTMKALAEASLSTPGGIAPYCRPFLDAVDEHPDGAALFVEGLIFCSDKASAPSFWTLWQEFADRIPKAPWIHALSSDDSVGAELILRMTLNVDLLRGLRYHKHLLNDEGRVSDLVDRLPATPYVLASFMGYLSTYGKRSQTAPLHVLARHLQTVKYREFPSDLDITYHLERMLQGYIGGKPATKMGPTLRKDILLILDWLVDARSPAAYEMRNAFTTLNAGDR